ncbi:hypothetical protein QQ045_032265 [Rhodiola kirilowii]
MAAPLPLLRNSLQDFSSTTRAHSIHRPFSASSIRFRPPNSIKMEGGGSEITEEVDRKVEVGVSGGKKVFVAGATGSTGKRIVEQLLARGFSVKAGVRDIEKAKTTFTSNNNNPALHFVKADVTEGSEKLAEVIGDDSDAVICATGFRPSWDLLAPWKVCLSQGHSWLHHSLPLLVNVVLALLTCGCSLVTLSGSEISRWCSIHRLITLAL